MNTRTTGVENIFPSRLSLGMLEERARPLRTRLTRIRAMNNAYYRPLITIFLSFRFLSKREPISRSVSPSRKDSARISRGFRAFNPPPPFDREDLSRRNDPRTGGRRAYRIGLREQRFLTHVCARVCGLSPAEDSR